MTLACVFFAVVAVGLGKKGLAADVEIIKSTDLSAGLSVTFSSQASNTVDLSLSLGLSSPIVQVARSPNGGWVGIGFQNGHTDSETSINMSGPRGTEYLLVHVKVEGLLSVTSTLEHRSLPAGEENGSPNTIRGKYPLTISADGSAQTLADSWVEKVVFSTSLGGANFKLTLACKSTNASSPQTVDLSQPVAVLFAYGTYGDTGPGYHATKRMTARQQAPAGPARLFTLCPPAPQGSPSAATSLPKSNTAGTDAPRTGMATRTTGRAVQTTTGGAVQTTAGSAVQTTGSAVRTAAAQYLVLVAASITFVLMGTSVSS